MASAPSTNVRRVVSSLASREVIAALSLIAAMVITAQLLGRSEVVFPEFAALCVGVLVYEIPRWRTSVWQIAVFPIAAAWIGIGLVATGLPEPVTWPVALAIAVVGLRLGNCHLGPTISAIGLPVLLRTSSVVYPLSVTVFCALLALVFLVGYADHLRGAHGPMLTHPAISASVAYWITIGGIALVANACGLRWFVVPPVAVACFGITQTGSPYGRRLGVMLAAAVIGGSIVHVLVGNIFIDVAIVSVAVIAVSQWYSMPLPPASALAVLPVLVPDGELTIFAVTSSIGCIVCMTAMWWGAPQIASAIARFVPAEHSSAELVGSVGPLSRRRRRTPRA